MVAYRFYCLDASGKIGLAEWYEASDDADAIRKAQKLKQDAHKCEVWQGARMVASLNAHGFAN